MANLKKSIPLAPYLACFFDLLNQRDKLEKVNYFTSDPEEIARWKTTWIEIIDGLRTFREVFEEGLRYAREALSRDLPWHTKEMNMLITELSATDMRVQMFSDSVILFAPISQDRPAKAAVDVQNVLIICSIIFGVAISNKVVFRGAIEAGPGAEIFEDDTGVYGPVLSHAYHLENAVAQYPRIVIGSQLRQLLDHFISESVGQSEGEIVRRAASFSKRLIAQDLDGAMILDYCSEAMSEVDESNNDVIGPALEFARNERRRFEEGGDKKLASRYDLLVHYLESRSNENRQGVDSA